MVQRTYFFRSFSIPAPETFWFVESKDRFVSRFATLIELAPVKTMYGVLVWYSAGLVLGTLACY